ncbi:MAG: PQQ-dependent sugar dehydrogenase [Verrucomicrobiota bacterium]|nr:PQQ-dependent sugar dehydrogenase [Verrucomicrobiota bacterium]
MLKRSFSIALLTASLGTLSAAEKPITASIQGHVFKPVQLKPSRERVSKLKAPAGFKMEIFAENLEKPRMMAVAPNGDLYVTRRGEEGDVLLLRDEDKDGKAEPPKTVAKIPHVHGIALHEGSLYLAAVRKLYVAGIKPDGMLEAPKELYGDLPDAGQHPNRTLAFSPGGELFLSVGSTCNDAPEPNPENATMLIVKTDGSGRSIFASGLRNTIGFDWQPGTGELYGMDHGIDWLGDDTQREELNHLTAGSKYGWPFVFEDGKRNPARDPKETTGMTWEEYAKTCRAPVLTATAHSAPMALLFYTSSQFPEEYRGDAFVTFHGSWNRGEPSGYKVARLQFKDGKPAEFEDFLTGFYLPKEKSQFGRPCGLALARDGSLLLSDDGGGVIYRISWAGDRPAKAAAR